MKLDKGEINFLNAIETKQNQIYVFGKKINKNNKELIPVIGQINFLQDIIWLKKIQNVRWNNDVISEGTDNCIFLTTTVLNKSKDWVPKLIKLNSKGDLIVSKSILNLEFSCYVEKILKGDNSFFVLLSTKNYIEVDFDLNIMEIPSRKDPVFEKIKTKYALIACELKYDFTTLEYLDENAVDTDLNSLLTQIKDKKNKISSSQIMDPTENGISQLEKLRSTNEFEKYLLKDLAFFE